MPIGSMIASLLLVLLCVPRCVSLPIVAANDDSAEVGADGRIMPRIMRHNHVVQPDTSMSLADEVISVIPESVVEELRESSPERRSILGGGAIALCMLSSFLTVWGFALQKIAAKEQEAKVQWAQCGEMVLSPMWLLGLFLGGFVPVLAEGAAYLLASSDWLAPLSAVTVSMNLFMAPVILGESVSPYPDIPATLLIVFGMVMTTSAGIDNEDGVVAPDQLYGIGTSPAFQIATTLLLVVLAFCMVYMILNRYCIEISARLRPSNPPVCQVLLPATGAACTGIYATVLLKALAGMFRADWPIHTWSACLALVVPLLFVRWQFLTVGLRLYDQTMFFPLYSALLAIGNSLFGALFRRDTSVLDTDMYGLGLCCVGVVTIGVGASFFHFRPQGPTIAGGFAGEYDRNMRKVHGRAVAISVPAHQG